MKVSPPSRIAAALLCILPCGLHAATPEPAMPPGAWTDKQLDDYSIMQQSISPAAETPAHKVRALYPNQTYYTTEQLKIALNTPAKVPKAQVLHAQTEAEKKMKKPNDALTYDQTVQMLKAYKVAMGLKADVDVEWALKSFYGVRDWYKPVDVADVEANLEKAPSKDPAKAAEDAAKAKKAHDDALAAMILHGRAEQDRSRTFREHPDVAFKSGFHMPLIRASWRDVLTEEDPSQIATDPKTQKDVVGAKISYAHNGNAGTDTWNVSGALIVPWFLDLASIGREDANGTVLERRAFNLDRLGFAPSVSINRVDTNAKDPKGEADSLLYRLGVYTDWGTKERQFEVETRAAFVYASDTGGRGRLPGFEVDVEPRSMNNTVPLGYRKILKENPLFDDTLTKASPTAITPNRSLWDISLRAWLHMEGGDVQDTGKTWDPTKGSFFRMGPSVQFQMNFPQARLFGGQDFSLNALYTCLPAISGSNEHENYVKVSAVWDLWNNPLTFHKVALSADYEYGGLSFTKEDVNQVTIGLAVKF